MGKTTIQVVVAVISALNTAAPLILDTQSVYPDWQWQYHALIGFLTFAAVMIWMVVDRQLKLNEIRPNIIPGTSTGQSEELSNKDIKTRINIRFRNAGTKSAHNICIRIGMAPMANPSQFQPFPDHTTPNPLDPSPTEYGRDFTIIKTVDSNAPTEWLFYVAVLYSDSPRRGKQCKKEWWLAYKVFDEHLDNATLVQKNALEPYVKIVFSKVDQGQLVSYIQESQPE